MALTLVERTVKEKSSWFFKGRIEDQDKVAIPAATIDTLTLTLYDVATGPPDGSTHASVINSRYDTSVLNVNNGTYTESNGSITAATDASPIVVTSATHGLSTGDRIYITGALGNTNANGEWLITKVDANSFSLDGSSGNGTWTSGGSWSYSLLTMEFLPADNAIKGTPAAGDTEQHKALFEVTYSTTREFPYEIDIFVEQLGKRS